jgi:hypothetical protein
MTRSSEQFEHVKTIDGVVVDAHEAPSPPPAFVEDSVIAEYAAIIEAVLRLSKKVLWVVAALVVLIAFVYGLLIAAKILLALIFLAIAGVCITIVIRLEWLIANLREVEEIGYLLQEETILSCMQARQGLSLVQAKIYSAMQPGESSLMPELIRNVGPLLNMIMKKETSMMSWAMFGFKIVKSAVEVARQRK